MTKALEGISRDPEAKLPGDLPGVSLIKQDQEALRDGVFMAHQKSWIEDTSALKACEKGRRTGITYAEAADQATIAAAEKGQGGNNCFYIGDTKEKGKEFIRYVAHFAKVMFQELGEIEEFDFEDLQDDGTIEYITAYRVGFKSGYRVEALSSNPSNIRGLQGVVCIDEAAFHRDVNEVLDAVMALLIWGGKVRVISTHNGLLNAFNDLVTDARARKNPFSVHRYTFTDAIKNGLYKRVCLMRGLTWSPEAEKKWEAEIRAAYGPRTSKMRQELDAVPSDAEGSVLSRVIIERAAKKDVPVVRWSLNDDFKTLEKHVREAAQRHFCESKLRPILRKLNKNRLHVFGVDFARKGDRTSIMIFEIGHDLVRRCVMVVEMHNVTFDQQRDVLFYLGKRLPKLAGGALDATGNGAYLAEAAAQKWGEIIHEIHLTTKWYSENATAYTEAFNDETVTIAADEDIVRDHQALQYDGEVIRVPVGYTYKGTDGLQRHGDSAVAGMLAYYISRQELPAYGYEAQRTSALTDDRRDRHSYGQGIDPDLRGTL